MIARRALLALSLLAGAGVLVSAPAQAGHERTTVVYETGHSRHSNYCPPPRYRSSHHGHYRGHQGHRYRGHHGYDRHAWKSNHHHGKRHYGHNDSGYRVYLEYRN